MNGHHADIEGRSRPSVAPTLQHHPTQHLLAARIQFSQQGIHPFEALVWIVQGCLGGGWQLVEEFGVERGRATQLAVAAQESPLFHGHADVLANLLILLRRGLGVTGHLFLQTGQSQLQFRLSAWQPHRGSIVAQIVENRPANVGSGEGCEGCLQGVAV
jgi:hypothetical protein